MNQVIEVGNTFTKLLAAEIGNAKLIEVRQRNARDLGVHSTCASHDFCDANMVMHAAFHELGLAAPVDFEENEQDGLAYTASVDLWNIAWTSAKAAGFPLPQPVGDFVRELTTLNTGGGCMVDFVHLTDGRVLGINEELVVLYRSMDDFHDHNNDQRPTIEL